MPDLDKLLQVRVVQVRYDDLTEEQLPIWDAGENHGYDIGYDEGYEAGYQASEEEGDDQNDLYDDGYHAGYIAGAEAEQARIQSVLGMMFESALNMGQGAKAIQYKHAMELLRPIDLKPNIEDDDF